MHRVAGVASGCKEKKVVAWGLKEVAGIAGSDRRLQGLMRVACVYTNGCKLLKVVAG